MRRAIRWACISFAVLLVLAASGGWLLFRASRQAPTFYQEVLDRPVVEQAAVGDEFEREVLELRNETRDRGAWQATFTMDQINAWLAVDLPEKFPEAIPRGVTDPRVVLEEGLIRGAARYQDGQIQTVLSFAIDVHLTEEPNTLAVRLSEVRAGLLPVPISSWLDKLEEKLRQTDLDVRWSQVAGDPVALVRLPPETGGQPGMVLRLESIVIEPGRLLLAGRTVAEAEWEATQREALRSSSGDVEVENRAIQP